MNCPGCEVPRRLAREPGTLLLAPRLAHTRAKLIEHLEGNSWEVRAEAAEVIAVAIGEGGLARLVGHLAAVLSDPESKGCNAVFLPESERFNSGHLARTTSVKDLMGLKSGEWLGQLLADGRVNMHYQPLVHASDMNRVFAYEALLRGVGEDGELIFPDRLFGAAAQSGMLFHMDSAARLAAIRQANEHGLETRLFINFNPAAIYDPQYCLRSTMAAARAGDIPPENFVFEVVESTEVADPDHLLRILDVYREAGFRVALDDLGAGYSSLNLLQRLRPDFVKFDRELVSGVDGDPYKAKILSRLIHLAGELDIHTVAEGVETAAEAEWVAETGVDYIQGYHVARPGSPPPLPFGGG